MKKFLILLISLLFLTACTVSPTETSDKTPDNIPEQNSEKTVSIKDYYPFKQNIRKYYEGKGMEYAEKDVYVDYMNDNRIQLRVINGGTILSQIIENKDGELRMLASLEEFYYRSNLLQTEFGSFEVLLKEPLIKGTSWTLTDGRKRYISGIDVKIDTPSGNYNALEVTTEDKEFKTLDYYVHGMGLVKSVFLAQGTIVESSLKKIESPANVKQTVKFYYPDFLKDRIVFIKDTLSFNTNDKVENIFERYFKTSPGKNISALISENTKINKLTLNRAENRAYVDFSKELVTEMNAGTSLESMIIQSITNTLGDYYNIDKVFITIEGKPYESGHIVLKTGESFYVNYKNIVEYK